jgi:hypothetical protein
VCLLKHQSYCSGVQNKKNSRFEKTPIRLFFLLNLVKPMVLEKEHQFFLGVPSFSELKQLEQQNNNADVAQLVEHSLGKGKVSGSSPVIGLFFV